MHSSVLALSLGLVGMEMGLGFAAWDLLLWVGMSGFLPLLLLCGSLGKVCQMYFLFPCLWWELACGTFDQHIFLYLIDAGGIQPPAWFFFSLYFCNHCL